jgi:hypothetical protein
MSVDELLPQARELVTDGQVPSRKTLQKVLRVRWERVTEVHRALTDEVELALQGRRDRRRAMLSQRQSRKTPGRRVKLRRPGLPEAPVSPGVGPVDAGRFPAAGAVAEEVTTAPAGVFPKASKRAVTWPVVLLALPAFVAIWSGWVDLGRLTGFGVVHPLPGIADEVALNTAITLPVGLETYAAYALYVWLSGAVPARARQFARRSAIGSLVLGAGGQVAYHLMVAAGMARAPWWITTVVACLPVAVLGMGAALRHLVHADHNEKGN